MSLRLFDYVLKLFLIILFLIASSEAGQWLAGGYYAIVWAITGDQDYKRDCMGLPNINSTKPCVHCPADSKLRCHSEFAWYDFFPEANWVQGIYGEDGLQRGGWDSCVLFQIDGVTNLSVYPDWMHDKNLGTDKVSSIIVKLCYILGCLVE